MPSSTHPSTSPSAPVTVAIAGGGLAGVAAGCALSEAGFRVTLFERRPYLGGRASSYQHPGDVYKRQIYINTDIDIDD